MNARKSGHERTKVWWTRESLMNARKSVERTKIWWTHESLMNARKSGERTKVCTWTRESLVNARKSGHERTKVWWTHESLVNARKSGHERTKVWWTHESLDIGTFRLGRSGHRHFPSGTVWVLNLGCFENLYRLDYKWLGDIGFRASVYNKYMQVYNKQIIKRRLLLDLYLLHSGAFLCSIFSTAHQTLFSSFACRLFSDSSCLSFCCYQKLLLLQKDIDDYSNSVSTFDALDSEFHTCNSA